GRGHLPGPSSGRTVGSPLTIRAAAGWTRPSTRTGRLLLGWISAEPDRRSLERGRGRGAAPRARVRARPSRFASRHATDPALSARLREQSGAPPAERA